MPLETVVKTKAAQMRAAPTEPWFLFMHARQLFLFLAVTGTFILTNYS